MNLKYPYFLFLFFCFSLNTSLNAQTENDSLAKYSYEELYKLINNTKINKVELSKIYTEEYLARAKFDKDTIKIARGYFYHSLFKKSNEKIIYLDSAIHLTKNKKHFLYPSVAYRNKGVYLYKIGENELALKYFFKALETVNDNVNLEIKIRSSIITLKSNWKSDEKTLEFTKKNLEFIINNKEFIDDYEKSYLNALGNLSKEYIENKNYEEGLKIAKEGIEESLKYKNLLQYYDFVFDAGTAQYYLKNYEATIDSLKKALPFDTDYAKVVGNYYIAKSYNKLKQPEKARFHFLKTDSIYQATKDIFPEMRNVYEHIIEYYKSKNDLKNQIKYYDRLLEVDKIIDSTYTYVTETVNKKFDTPEAIAERNRLLEEAKAKESSWKYSFVAISSALLIILGVLVAAFRRQKYYKKRFESLMNVSDPENKNTKTETTSIERSRNALLEKEKNTSTPLSVKREIGVPPEIVESILSQLQKFETTQKFTKQVSLTELAKKLGTNPKYLSKVINGHYEKNFTSYINELRIEYVISKLKTDSKFRNYTIKAIGKEAGFGNTESFSKAFYKTTGIKPSYFIKQLHKRLEN